MLRLLVGKHAHLDPARADILAFADNEHLNRELRRRTRRLRLPRRLVATGVGVRSRETDGDRRGYLTYGRRSSPVEAHRVDTRIAGGGFASRFHTSAMRSSMCNALDGHDLWPESEPTLTQGRHRDSLYVSAFTSVFVEVNRLRHGDAALANESSA